MSRSTDDEPPRLEENDHLLASYSHPMHIPVSKGTTFRRHEGIEDADIELGSPTLPLTGIESPIPNTHEEDSFTGIPNLIHSRHSHGGIKESAAHIFDGLCQWVKGPQPPRPFKMSPFLPWFQNAPIIFLHKHLPERNQRFGLLLIVCFLWVSVFSGVLSASLSRCQVFGYNTPVRLSCNSRFW